jgi:tetratricopeptide (TPR) repeat protein
LAVTFLVYSTAGGLDFLDFDDSDYVVHNPMVSQGLSWEGWTWAWTTFHVSNWHPLTWLSHMLDCQLFGLAPGGHHLSNLFFHLGNTLLLFHLLRVLTGQLWRPALVAALFAVHPLHVESVAWVSERKDLLSTFFGLLALEAYAWYCRQPGRWRYTLVALAFALSLLAKPMLVTLPFVMLLLDYWPLSRFSPGPVGDQSRESRQRSGQIALQAHRPVPELVLEKVPLLLLSALSCLLTILAQRSLALVSLDTIPFEARVANALLSYVRYLDKAAWPLDLAIYYSHTQPELTSLPVILSALCVLVVTGLTVSWRHSRPALLVGWLWYVGTLVPVIGLVQVGGQSMADRYTYVPLIGIFLALAWFVPDCRRSGSVGIVTAGVLAVVVSFLAVSTWFQLKFWRNEASVWHHALEVTQNNAMAEAHWGILLLQNGEVEEAEQHLKRAITLAANFGEAKIHLGILRLWQERLDESEELMSRALEIHPTNPQYHHWLGKLWLRRGRLDTAAAQFREAVDRAPLKAEYHCNLGFTLDAQGNHEAAAAAYARGMQLDAAVAQRANQVAQLLLKFRDPRLPGFLSETLFLAQQAAAATQGQNVDVLLTLAEAWQANGRTAEAVAEARRALALARSTGPPDLVRRIEEQLRKYESTPGRTP